MDPDPVKGTEPRIRICTKMSWIANTASYTTGGAAAAVLLPGGAGSALLDLFPAHHPRTPGQGQEDVRDPPEVPGHEGISCCLMAPNFRSHFSNLSLISMAR